MSENPIQIFIATFDNETEAKETLADFKWMDSEGSIELIDAAVIVRENPRQIRHWAVCGQSRAHPFVRIRTL